MYCAGNNQNNIYRILSEQVESRYYRKFKTTSRNLFNGLYVFSVLVTGLKNLTWFN